MNGLFQRARAVIMGTSTGIASRETKMQLGSFDNLGHRTIIKIWSAVIYDLCLVLIKKHSDITHFTSIGFSSGYISSESSSI